MSLALPLGSAKSISLGSRYTLSIFHVFLSPSLVNVHLLKGFSCKLVISLLNGAPRELVVLLPYTLDWKFNVCLST